MFSKNFSGPMIMKETSDLERIISDLESLLKVSDGSIVKNELNEELYKAKQGLIGESEVLYQLKSSDIDMIILHDINLAYDDLESQIDFIVITRKKTYIIEVKNINGNIEITDKGDFIVTTPTGEQKALNSPINQNDIHMNLIKKLRLSNKPKLISNDIYKKSLENNYRSLIVFANKETIINDKSANEEIRNIVIRADQIISKIKEIDESEKKFTRTDEDMNELASFFIKNHIQENNAAAKRFISLMDKFKEQRMAELANKVPFILNTKCPNCGSNLILKTAVKGPRAGKHFLGCSNYPKCNYINNIDN